MVPLGVFLYFQPADRIKDNPGIFLFLCLFFALRNSGKFELAVFDILYGAAAAVQKND